MVFGSVDFLHKLGDIAPTLPHGDDAHVCVAKNNHEQDYYNHPNMSAIMINHPIYMGAEDNNSCMMYESVINYNHPYGKNWQDNNFTTDIVQERTKSGI